MAGVRVRSHLFRPLDPGNVWNRAIVVVSTVAGLFGAALTVAFDREPFLAVLAGGSTFLSWALARELDPDQQASALVAAVAGGTWALVGMPTALLPMLGLMLASRIVVETTGRRPLVGDLVAMVVLVAAISFTLLGWVMGFGLAVALYVDDRLAEEHTRQALLAALAGAVASTAVVTLSGAVPESPPEVHPFLAAMVGVLALAAVGREPVDPVTFVDSRHKRFLRRDRVHAGRALSGLLIFVGALVTGDDAPAVVPMAVALAVALVSSELERWRRRRIEG
jgi:hypothetical protein